MAAIDLLRLNGHVVSDVRQEAFDHWGQQGHQAIGVFVIRAVGGINHCGTPKDEGTCAFNERLLFHQGTTNVWVNDQWIGWAVWILHASDSAPLQTIVGVI